MAIIDELEEAISEVSSKIGGAFGEQVCAEYLYKILLDFDIMYEKMSDYDKRAFFQNFIKSIEIYPDSKSKGRILRHVDFRFPVSYDASEEQKLLLTRNDVETIVVLSKGIDISAGKVQVEFSVEDMDLSAAHGNASITR